jgi:hypothetical protein
MSIGPISKIEAVNYLLSMIGEMPVNSIDDSQFTPSNLAEQEIDRASREVQMEGLNCNYEEDYPVSPDSSDEIQIPSGVLAVDCVDRNRNLVWRSGKLYDKDNHTFKFEDSIRVNIIWGLDFENLPEHIRQYIVIRAGRAFQDKYVGSELLHKLSQQDELEARSKMLSVEEENKDYNFLTSPISYYGSLGRNRW